MNITGISNRILILVSIFIIFNSPSTAQIGIGEWRDHFSYSRCNFVALANNKVYGATKYALFSFDIENNDIGKLSRTNGLSDVGISAIRYSKEYDLLVVAYENANIDLVFGNLIINLNDIKNKSIQGLKRINHIEFKDELAYLSCGFGIVVIDILKKEIKDTYYIGDNASSVEVLGITFSQDLIYAATASGVYTANLNDNLIDYNNWEKDISLELPEGKYPAVLSFGSEILLQLTNTLNGTSIIYRKNGTQWERVYDYNTSIKNLNISNNLLTIVEPDKIIVLNENFTENEVISSYVSGNSQPAFCEIDNMGNKYIADLASGLVYGSNGNFNSLSPNGPFTNNAFDMDARDGRLWVAGGGRNSTWGSLYQYCEAYSFIDNRWRSKILWDSEARDFVKILVNPFNSNEVFAASWSHGVFVFNNNELTTTYNQTNSSLQFNNSSGNVIQIGGIAIDDYQNLYITNSDVDAPISVRTYDGSWYSYDYTGIRGKGNIGEIITTQYGHKWVQIGRGGGLFAFDDNYTPDDMSDDRSTLFKNRDVNNQLLSNEIYAIAEDKDGVIWVGTDEGVLTYYNPQNVFSGENFYADRIKVVDTKTDTVVQYLLAKEKITAIAIDGANRKWFGTESSGVFLMSEDGQEEIFHFNSESSKLPSNKINSIAINDKNGEVFFGTDVGIVSFKGTATEGDDNYSDAYVYPNPVRENYDGPITITGLAENVNVKVTDITGQLVYETTAFGGQAIWNGKNYLGNKVNTGVYLIFCTDDLGEKTKVLKLLVIK